MTDHPVARGLAAQRSFALDELAQAQHLMPLRTIEELVVADLWESDDELVDFLSDLANARHQDMA